MNRPIRTTLILAFLSGFVVYPASIWLLTPILGWPMSARLILWAVTTVYTLFLVHWSNSKNTKAFTLIFPLGLLFGAALWPPAHGIYFLIMVGVFVWIRSGICFQERPIRAVIAELITAVGGLLVVGVWSPSGILQWGLGIWLFGLVQCLYFYVVPTDRIRKATVTDNLDPFETASRELEQVLNRQWEP